MADASEAKSGVKAHSACPEAGVGPGAAGPRPPWGRVSGPWVPQRSSPPCVLRRSPAYLALLRPLPGRPQGSRLSPKSWKPRYPSYCFCFPFHLDFRSLFLSLHSPITLPSGSHSNWLPANALLAYVLSKRVFCLDAQKFNLCKWYVLAIVFRCSLFLPRRMPLSPSRLPLDFQPVAASSKGGGVPTSCLPERAGGDAPDSASP